ncbi:TetR/AcrR family transcriptional regulator [Microbacterium sp. NPDC057407]|uniref:TetR/AcrR family transcriptional regulator n=1 Tax=Microbacterium sp. NPDC057407 TaxID=3346120 RepID=UPI00366BD03D
MTAPRSGPMRSEAARQAVLRATSQLLAEVGYDRLTMEGIASRAGVSKQTIYRWWTSRSAVVAEALVEGLVLSEQLAVPDTGDLRNDLTSWLAGLAELIDDPQSVGPMRSIIMAATHSPEIASQLEELLVPTVALTERLTAAIGQAPHLRADTPVDTVIEMVFGALLVRVITQSPLDEGAIDNLVAVVLGPDTARG